MLALTELGDTITVEKAGVSMLRSVVERIESLARGYPGLEVEEKVAALYSRLDTNGSGVGSQDALSAIDRVLAAKAPHLVPFAARPNGWCAFLRGVLRGCSVKGSLSQKACSAL